MSWTPHGPDIELGCPHNLPTSLSTVRICSNWLYSQFRCIGAIIGVLLSNFTHSDQLQTLAGHQIEDEPRGYAQFSSLMAAHRSFQIFRRFGSLRTRLALLAQDRIVQLEAKLRGIDQNETRPLFLSSHRRDRNEERREILSDLADALKGYDEILERNTRILNLEIAQPEHIISLQNWDAGTACISREETEFLYYPQDLLSLSPPGDSLLSWLERRISGKLLKFSKRGRSLISNNPHVHIYSQYYMRILTRTMVVPLLIVLVVVPIVICNSCDSLNARLAVIVMATSIFLTVLALLTDGKVLDLAVAGATYTTVLVVFLSQTS